MRKPANGELRAEADARSPEPSAVGVGEWETVPAAAAALAAAATASALVRLALAAALAAAKEAALEPSALACSPAPGLEAAAAFAALSRERDERMLRSAWKEADVTMPRRWVVPSPGDASAGRPRDERGNEPAEGDLVILRVILGRALKERLTRIRREPLVSLATGGCVTSPPCDSVKGPCGVGRMAKLSDWSMIRCSDFASPAPGHTGTQLSRAAGGVAEEARGGGSGVRRRRFCSSAMAIAMTFAHLGWFFSCAQARASRPSWVSPSSARPSMSSLAHAWWPCIAAAISGVVPRRLGMSIEALAATRASTQLSCPRWLATHSGVKPLVLRKSTLALAAARSSTHRCSP